MVHMVDDRFFRIEVFVYNTIYRKRENNNNLIKY